MSIESAFESVGINFTYGEEIKEHRCKKCKRIIGKLNSYTEIKCPKRKEVDRIGENE